MADGRDLKGYGTAYIVGVDWKHLISANLECGHGPRDVIARGSGRARFRL
jgi:hypothetical protein